MQTFIDWANFTPEAVAEALPKALESAEAGVASVERNAAEAGGYADVIWALEDAEDGPFRIWGRVSHMVSVMNSDAWRRVQETFQAPMVQFSLRVGQSRKLYEAYRRLAQAEADPVRRRIASESAKGAELAGVALEGRVRARFNEISERLATLANDFSNAVLDATNAFTFEKDGRKYTIDDANYPETMKTCADREVREALCRARATRAPENTARIAEILALRHELAGLLGFADYNGLSFATKCAPSVAAVQTMIDELDEATRAASEAEDAELATVQDWPGALEPWDRAFLAERLRERKYAYSEQELKQHFDFPVVLRGLFRMSRMLFDVEVEEWTGERRPSVWHPDVRFFAVKEKGEEVAHFYLDPYVRNGRKSGGAWMNEFRNRCDRRGDLPLSLIVLNLPVPDAEGRCLMSFREVETLFHEFGHALQCMLTRVGEEGAAGISLVEWDAVEVASQFMENWVLDARSGIEVPAGLKAKVRAARNFRAASDCRRQLSFARTDLLLHGSGKVDDPDAVKREVFAHFGMPMVAGDIFLNAFTHIFSGGYSAGYYGYKWSEVMSADCYGAFEEAPLSDDAAVRAMGARYRETVLALGGSKSALDVFREFRGRDPGIGALLRQMGLR